jgi:Protein of unknown function (DUF3147)
MIVKIHTAALKESKWHEYVIRFAFGGLITAITGAIAGAWGPGVAGLFLAFPAIFPASATLLEKHERERKGRKGMRGERRAREVAADDALGAAMGGIGLLFFAVTCWWMLPRYSPGLALGAAVIAWLVAAFTMWLVRKLLW